MADNQNNRSETVIKTRPSKKGKMSNWMIALIIVGVGLIAGVIGYLTYAAVITYATDECIPQNNYCEGVFPFNTTHSHGSDDFVVKKPVIYLYPQSEISVGVKLGNPDLITTSYPQYTDGWSVLAQPDGTLTDLNTGRELYSLYWEGSGANFGTSNEGFIVKGTDTSEFLEEKLAILGLNARETEEFIIYWLPQLQENEYNYIRFASSEEIDDYMPLLVEPRPDTMIRVLMLYKPLDKAIDVDEQELAPMPNRDGFTLVEWGGSKLE